MMKRHTPWWLKVALKLTLSRLPLSYAHWAKLGLFRHGEMNRPQQALKSLTIHASTAGFLASENGAPRFSREDMNILELGPGDSAFTAPIAYAMGAKQTWLIDAGPFATTEMSIHRELLSFLEKNGFPTRNIHAATSFPALLSSCNARYLTNGVSSFRQIRDSSIDFCFSNAVLEHIPRPDFQSLALEMARILKPDGACVHRVDLQDHLGGALNNLRFSNTVWESKFFRSSGFYTNRIRFAEMIGIFESAGFNCQIPRIVCWDRLPTPRYSMTPGFSSLPDSDLLVKGFDIVLTHKGQP